MPGLGPITANVERAPLGPALLSASDNVHLLSMRAAPAPRSKSFWPGLRLWGGKKGQPPASPTLPVSAVPPAYVGAGWADTNGTAGNIGGAWAGREALLERREAALERREAEVARREAMAARTGGGKVGSWAPRLLCVGLSSALGSLDTFHIAQPSAVQSKDQGRMRPPSAQLLCALPHLLLRAAPMPGLGCRPTLLVISWHAQSILACACRKPSHG